MNANPIHKVCLKRIYLLIAVSALVLATLACSLGAARGRSESPTQEGPKATASATPKSTGGESGDAAAVVAKLPDPPTSRAITMGDVPEDTSGPLKMMFSLDGTERVFLSDAMPLEVMRFYADELGKHSYINPYLPVMIQEGKLITAYLDFFKEGSEEAMIRVFASPEESTGKTLVFLKVIQ